MNAGKKIAATPLWAAGVARLAVFATGLVAAGLVAAEARSAELQLALPIRCTPGEDCFIQNYVDRDPGPAWRDHACGRLSYDGHAGTDFRLRSLRQMEQGVEVVAAAAGTVLGVRDGEPDVSIRERPLPAGEKKQAGNGARIDHGDGWTTQYSHLRRGSLRVSAGQRVKAGDVIGLVGLSGNTEFPHLDFSVAKAGQTVDPFVPAGDPPCGSGGPTLWSAPARALLDYRASGVLVSGYADRVLSPHEIQRGDRFQPVLAPNAPALVFHVEVFGIRSGDVEEVSLTGPGGRTLATRRDTLPTYQAVRRVHLGKRLGTSAWPAGSYLGRYALRRDGELVAEVRQQLQVEPR